MAVVFPSKFATSFTFASILFMASSAMIRGPRTMIMGLLDPERRRVVVGKS
jgi:hypothetical protein